MNEAAPWHWCIWLMGRDARNCAHFAICLTCLTIGGFSIISQKASMTEERVSPLRQRMIKDHAHPRDGGQGTEVAHPGDQGFRRFPRAIRRETHSGRVSADSGLDPPMCMSEKPCLWLMSLDHRNLVRAISCIKIRSPFTDQVRMRAMVRNDNRLAWKVSCQLLLQPRSMIRVDISCV